MGGADQEIIYGQATEITPGVGKVVTQLIIEDETTTNDTDFVTGKKFWQGWNKGLTLTSFATTTINTPLTGLVISPNSPITAADTILSMAGKLQAQTDALQTALNLKLNGYFFTFNSTTPGDSTRYYFNNLFVALSTSDIRRFRFKAGTIKDAVFTLSQSTNGSGENVTIKLINITTAAESTIGTFTSNFGASQSTGFVFSGLNITVNSTDLWALVIDTPAFASNPANWIGGLTLNILE